MEAIVYFLVWAGLILLMMRFGCGAHVMGHGHNSRTKQSEGGSNTDLRWIAPESAIDPVGGITVHTNAAKSAVHDGHVFYFCSRECRERFEAAPDTYLNQETATLETGEAVHG